MSNMANPVLSSIRKRSSKSRSRSNTPIQKHFLSSSDELLDVPAMNTRSSSRQQFTSLEDSASHFVKYKTSDYSSEEGEVSPTLTNYSRTSVERENRRNGHKEKEQAQRDLLAYKEYREAGEYWNKYPKTDYTYSKRSPHRRELPSGSVALPNMSRPSLRSFDERMDKKYLAERVTYADKCTSKRYSDLTPNMKNVYTTGSMSSNYRNDENFLSSRYNGRDVIDVRIEQENYSFLTRLWMKVVSIVTWTKSWFVNTQESDYRTPGKRQMNLEKGVFSRAYSWISHSALWLMTWVYWLIGSVLVLDCKLLCGRETPPRSRTRTLVLLLLLPLLLLCAWWLYLHSYNELMEQTSTATNFILSLPNRSLDAISYSSSIISDIARSPWSYITSASSYVFTFIIDTFNNLFHNISAILSTVYDILCSVPSYIYNILVYSTSMLSYLLTNVLSLFTYWFYGILSYLKSDTIEVPSSSQYKSDIQYSKLDVKYDFSDDDLNNKIHLYLNNYLKNNDFSDFVQNKILVSPKHIEQISDIIKNEIHLHQSDFVDNDFITRIAILVKEKLDMESEKLVLTPLHIQQIIDGLKSSGDLNFGVNKIDTSNLVLELTKSPILQNFILERSVDKTHMENQLNLLKDLESQIGANKRDIEFLKMSNINFDNNMERLQNFANELQVKHDDLRDDISSIQKHTAESINSLNVEFRKLLTDILGYDVNTGTDNFKIWINSAFVAKDELEDRLAKLRSDLKENSQATIDASSGILMKYVADSIKAAILRYSQEQNQLIANLKNEFKTTNNIVATDGLSEFNIQKIVQDALNKFDADKTGLVDYALEHAGGQVLSTRCTESYNSRTAQYVWMGIPLWYSTNTPRTAITPGTHPGQCWAFQGFPGYLVLKLSMPIQVTGFTMEHVSPLVVADGNIDSAPKNFSVWGLQSLTDPDPLLFGYFTYQENSTTLQYFPVLPTESNQDLFEIVELRMESNHGNSVFTCLYRFRVHGNPKTANVRTEHRM